MGKINCPLCGSDEIKYERRGDTHIWICKPCPFVGFEFVHDIDAENVKNYLTKSI